MMKRAAVIFQNGAGRFEGRPYTYISPIEDLDSGELIVVETVYGLAIAKFIGYIKSTSGSKRIVSRIDLSYTPDLKYLGGVEYERI